jgi:HK97 family phage portal protein
MMPISQFVTSKKISTSKPGNRPMFTSLSNEGGVLQPSRFADNSYRVFWKWFKNSPELIGTISIPITDILGDRPHFTDAEGGKLSKSETIKAQKMWRDNRGKETLRAFLFDAFITGDSYLWKGKPTTKQINSAVKEACKKLNINTFQMKELMVKAAQDEDLKGVKKFDYVAASTMTILHDQFEILGYTQNSLSNHAHFKPEEIIHYRFLTLDGRVEGFSPVQALSAEVFLLSFVKKNMLAYMENGGSPDKVFILPKEIAKSKNHQFLLQQLQQYKRVQNRHGNLVFTGDIDIKDLQGSPKDLEYKDLALYVTSNIAFAFGIPVSRIPYLIGSSATSGDSGGLAESGYWNRISDMQDSIEDLLNSQLFEAMDLNIRFNRKYKQDEVREAQTANMLADTVTKYQDILGKGGKQITLKKTLELLDWNDEDVEELEMSEESEDLNSSNSLDNQNRLSNNEVLKEPDNRKRANTKRNVANQKGSAEAVTQP